MNGLELCLLLAPLVLTEAAEPPSDSGCGTRIREPRLPAGASRFRPCRIRLAATPGAGTAPRDACACGRFTNMPAWLSDGSTTWGRSLQGIQISPKNLAAIPAGVEAAFGSP